MQDYTFIDDEGRRMPVAAMSTEDIVACLERGVEVEGRTERPRDIMSRLQLELEIRQKGLRG